MLEASLPEECREYMVRVECVDDNLPGTGSRKRGTHERVSDLVVFGDHGSYLVEEPAPSAETVLGDAIRDVDEVAIVWRAVERPLEQLVPSSTCLLVLFDHDLQVGCG